MAIDPDFVNIPFDREQAFLVFATFCGDIERTAHALSVRPEVLLRMVDDEGWTARLAPLIELRRSSRPGDIERAINRALNFVQAHKFRLFVERVIARITQMSPKEFEDYLLSETVNKAGAITHKLSTRALADLASAMEKAHSLSYSALNDTAQERVRRKEDDEGTSAADLHVRLAKAMQDAKASETIRAKLFDAQLATAHALAAPKAAPSPMDNDDH